MCLDLLVPSVEVRAMAPWLSILRLIGGPSIALIMPISAQIRLNQIASFVASDAAMYSASLLLVATQVCLREIHEIGALPYRKMNPLTDFLPVLGPPQSESEYPTGR